jgi:hypothetical protein
MHRTQAAITGGVEEEERFVGAFVRPTGVFERLIGVLDREPKVFERAGGIMFGTVGANSTRAGAGLLRAFRSSKVVS